MFGEVHKPAVKTLVNQFAQPCAPVKCFRVIHDLILFYQKVCSQTVDKYLLCSKLFGMKSITVYLAGLPVEEREPFARRCGTTIGYLRKAVSVGQRLGESLCIALERESGRQIRCEELRPDVDWAYLRGTAANDQAREVA